eukprot:1861495-Amphidinium_carterae.1
MHGERVSNATWPSGHISQAHAIFFMDTLLCPAVTSLPEIYLRLTSFAGSFGHVPYITMELHKSVQLAARAQLLCPEI